MPSPAAKKNIKAIVTCGPTREPIDAVRFVSNRSSGILGVEVAKALLARGIRVELLCGPIEAAVPVEAACARFETARDLLGLLSRKITRCDLLFMAAAVSDFAPERRFAGKLKRSRDKSLALKLTANPDILLSLAPRKKGVWVGFCVESENLVQNATDKLKNKNLDLILAQKVSGKRDPFGDTRLDSVLLRRRGRPIFFRSCAKSKVASVLVDEALRAAGLTGRKVF